ncbi:F0F1 ATP synthase subunit A [Hymenobacter actinosclerus]|uniref:ATP synthase subunit a n=1 Tax=Hymenobacter actinosclerus TaxID=82805 RepID=A0A1H9Z8U4_9BACT|nr:F0F1 ATP synthase subunit A [Hymenobacter actinosclerus]SES77973.1 ATP synthase F0 subcomplex A subunit [Hymenobacter actinosclerus]
MKRLLFALFCLLSLTARASEPVATTADATESENFNPGEMILHHIGDSHEWHWFSTDNDHYTTYLPIIAFRPGQGVAVFSSRHLAEGEVHEGLKLEHEHLVSTDGAKVYDFSITKNVATLMIASALLLVVFMTVARGYAKRGTAAPRGVQSFFEPIIVFIRDEVAKKSIGPKYERYLPYLLTVFFFIWFSNLLGLLPGSSNLTGNISVTMTLAVITLLITLFSSNKNYWAHIFATPGVPKLLLPIMIPVELIGIVVKPFSLMVRLFANITAGHIVTLSFISLIFIFRNVGVAPVSLAFGLFINMLELLVAILQAYIFTLLTAMYIGGAVEDHHDADYQMGGGDGATPAQVH